MSSSRFHPARKIASNVRCARACTVAACLAVLLLTTAPVPAAPAAAGLAKTRQQISEIRKRLEAARGKALQIQTEVTKLDAQVGKLNTQIASGQRAVASLESDIRSAQAQIAELERQYEKAVEASNDRARRLYKQGPAQSVAVLFDVRSIGELARLQFWLERSSELDSKTIVAAARLKGDLGERQTELNRAKKALDDQEQLLQQRKAVVEAAMGDRKRALADVQQEIEANQRHVEALAGDSRRLTEELRKAAARPAPQVTRRPSVTGDEAGEGGAASASGFLRPVGGAVTSPFGRRWGRAHTGVDIDGNTGDPIRATQSGVISGVPCGGGYGICTIIDHGAGVTSLYAHMSRKAVSGGSVTRGQVIGYIGCSGSCTGSHIHFEIRFGGVPRNPMSYV